MNPQIALENSVNALQTRRQLFGKSAMGLGTMALGSLLQGESQSATLSSTNGGLATLPHALAKAKRVIYLFMNGAPTHCDLFDYKPELIRTHGQPVPDSLLSGQTIQHDDGRPQRQEDACAG